MQKKTTSVYSVRRENLLAIIGRRFGGNKSAMAEALGFQQPALIYRYLARKQIGAALARRIERVAEMPEFWLDTDHRPLAQLEQTTAAYHAVNRTMLSVAITAVEERMSLASAGAKTGMILACYDLLYAKGTSDAGVLKEFLDGVAGAVVAGGRTLPEPQSIDGAAAASRRKAKKK